MCEVSVTFEIIKAQSILISFHLMEGSVTGGRETDDIGKEREVMKITLDYSSVVQKLQLIEETKWGT